VERELKLPLYLISNNRSFSRPQYSDKKIF